MSAPSSPAMGATARLVEGSDELASAAGERALCTPADNSVEDSGPFSFLLAEAQDDTYFMEKDGAEMELQHDTAVVAETEDQHDQCLLPCFYQQYQFFIASQYYQVVIPVADAQHYQAEHGSAPGLVLETEGRQFFAETDGQHYMYQCVFQHYRGLSAQQHQFYSEAEVQYNQFREDAEEVAVDAFNVESAGEEAWSSTQGSAWVDGWEAQKVCMDQVLAWTPCDWSADHWHA